MLLPVDTPAKLSPRVDFRPEEFKKLLFSHGLRLKWEQAATCPCNIKVTANEGVAAYLKTGFTGETRVACPACNGTGVIYHSSQEVRAIVTSARTNPERFKLYGEHAEGAMGLTLLPEHLPGFLDRFTLLDAVIVYTETRERKKAKASATITVTSGSAQTVGDKVTINVPVAAGGTGSAIDVPLVASNGVPSLESANSFQSSTDKVEQARYIAAAINNAVSGVFASTENRPVVTIQATTSGTAGNAITVVATQSSSWMTVSGSPLSGGDDNVMKMRYPIVKRTLALTGGSKTFGTMYLRSALTDNVMGNIATTVCAEDTDFSVNGDGDLDFSSATSKTPAVGNMFTVSYYANPRFIVRDHPHSLRVSYVKEKSVSATKTEMPVNVNCWLEFRGDPERFSDG